MEDAKATARFYALISLFLFVACAAFGAWHGDAFTKGAAAAFGVLSVVAVADLTRLISTESSENGEDQE